MSRGIFFWGFALVLACVFYIIPIGRTPAGDNPKTAIRELLLEKQKTAQQLHDLYEQWVNQGKLEAADTKHLEASKRLLDSEIDLSETQAQRIAAWEKYRSRARNVEQSVKDQFRLGRITPERYYEAKYRLLEAEVGLAKAKNK